MQMIETQEDIHQPSGCAHVFHKQCIDLARQSMPEDAGQCPTCWENDKFLKGVDVEAAAKVEDESGAETVAGTPGLGGPSHGQQEQDTQVDPADDDDRAALDLLMGFGGPSQPAKGLG